MAKAKTTKPANLQEAKIQVREAIGKVAKDAKQSYRDYKYVSHEAVTAAVVPAMHKVGMTHTPSCESIEVHDGVAFVRVKILFQMASTWDDTDDPNIESTYAYTADKIKDGTSMGAIISYGVKTALLKYFGLESGDPDLEEFQKPKAAMKPVAKKETVKAPEVSTLEIFNGVLMAGAEDLKRFLDLCKETGITSEQLDSRLEAGGYKVLENVPENVMIDWIERLETANG